MFFFFVQFLSCTHSPLPHPRPLSPLPTFTTSEFSGACSQTAGTQEKHFRDQLSSQICPLQSCQISQRCWVIALCLPNQLSLPHSKTPDLPPLSSKPPSPCLTTQLYSSSRKQILSRRKVAIFITHPICRPAIGSPSSPCACHGGQSDCPPTHEPDMTPLQILSETWSCGLCLCARS